MQTRGDGVKNPENIADVICTWPLTSLPDTNEPMTSDNLRSLWLSERPRPSAFAPSENETAMTAVVLES